MENFDIQERIEQYLNGTLSKADKEAVEAQMASDPAFRAEVELHRQLHAEFEDPKKLQLRDLMREITQAPPKPNLFERFKWPVVVLLILLIGWACWTWFTHTPAPAPNTPKQEIKTPQTPANEPVATQNPQTAPTEPTDKKPERQIAMANPADFAINRAFEDHVGSNLRATNGAAELSTPRVGANFTPDNGKVTLFFKGTVGASSDTQRFPLLFKIYNNQPNTEPLFNLNPNISSQGRTTSQWSFVLSSKVSMKPGLYYFTIERQEDGDLVYTGKFTVGAK
jgi:hypothetical protein